MTAVRRDGGKLLIDFVDMNGGTYLAGTDAKTTDFGVFKNRTRTWDPSIHRFILATP